MKKKEISPAIPSLNVALLRKVQKHILEEPRRLVMSLLAIKKGESIIGYYSDVPKRFASCGTAGCIAGWALILSGVKPCTMEEEGKGADEAAELLGVNDSIGTRLFFTWSWPAPFRCHYANAKTPKKRARVTSERIDYFIETGE